MKISQKCIEKHNKKEFVLKDKKNPSEVRFKNSEQRKIIKIDIDGCAITEGEKCDFLVHIPELEKSILVETKGSNVRKAISQLETTYEKVKPLLYKEVWWIVSATRVPSAIHGDILVEVLRVKRKYKATLVPKGSPVKFDIEKNTFS